MNILILNGSPKGEKSDTMKITKAFVEGINLNGDWNEDYINVKDSDINPCTGCFSCWTRTPGKCVLKDDMDGIIEKILSADVLIWSFPLYFFGMPSKIKSLLDRTLPLACPELVKRDDGGYTHESRYKAKDQKTVLISACGFSSVVNNYEALTKQFEIMYGKGFDKILCPEGPLMNVPEAEVIVEPYLEKVRNAGREFSEKGKFSDVTKIGLSELIMPADMYNEAVNKNWKSKN